MSTFVSIFAASFSPLSRRFIPIKVFNLYHFRSLSAYQLCTLAHKVKGRGKQFMVCCLFNFGYLYRFPLAPSGGAAGKPTPTRKLSVAVFGQFAKWNQILFVCQNVPPLLLRSHFIYFSSVCLPYSFSQSLSRMVTSHGFRFLRWNRAGRPSRIRSLSRID